MTDIRLQFGSVSIPASPSPGRGAWRVLRYVLLTVFMFLPVVAMFLPATLFNCDIRSGRRTTWLVFGSALTIIAIVLGVSAYNSPGALSADVRLTYAYLAAEVLALALPAMLVLPLLERQASFGTILVTALLVALPGLAVTEAASRAFLGCSLYADQIAQFEQTKAAVVARYQQTPGIPAGDVTSMQHVFGMLSNFVPSMSVITVIVFFMFSILMFGRLNARREFVRTREVSASAGIYLFRNFSLPEWLLFAFVISGLAPLASGMLQKVASNVLVVVLFLYLLQGLAIFRSLMVAIGSGSVGFLFALLMLGFLTLTAGIGPILLTIAGLFDSFFDFRKFRRKDDSNESHTD